MAICCDRREKSHTQNNHRSQFVLWFWNHKCWEIGRKTTGSLIISLYQTTVKALSAPNIIMFNTKSHSKLYLWTQFKQCITTSSSGSRLNLKSTPKLNVTVAVCMDAVPTAVKDMQSPRTAPWLNQAPKNQYSNVSSSWSTFLQCVTIFQLIQCLPLL